MTAKKRQPNWVIGSALSLVCVAYQALYRAVPVNGDLLLGLPIGKEYAHPGFYSPHDLLVSSGIRGPYHLYKYLGGFLYSIGADVDFIWQSLFLLFLFLTFLSVWFLSQELTRDSFSSTLVLALLAVAHPIRGTLHAAAVPITSFVTALAAMPFALASLVLLLRKQFFAAMALSSFVFNIHPYVGAMAAGAIGIAIFFRSDDSLRNRIAVVVGGGLLALPNVAYIVTHLPSNFAAGEFDFYSQFRLYAMHAFVEDHWREGYGWFFLNLAGAVWCSRFIDWEKRRTIWILFSVWFLLMGVYVLNAYVFKNTAILLMFLFRATYFIKPIVFIVVVHGLRCWRAELGTSEVARSWWQPWEFTAGIAVLFVSAILPMKFAVLADALSLTGYGLFILILSRQTKSLELLSKFFIGIGLFVLIVCAGSITGSFGSWRETVESCVVGIVVALACVWIITMIVSHPFASRTPPGTAELPSTSRLILVALTVLLVHHLLISLKDRRIPFLPDLAEMRSRIMMHQAPARTSGLMQWARTASPQSSLFVIPPDAWEEFGSFRLVAERGLYITITEVNQLAFDASIYRAAHQRLLELGVAYPSRRVYDTEGYYKPTNELLENLRDNGHVDFIVFEKSRMSEPVPSFRAAYDDGKYIVLNLHEGATEK